jgi:hypothetical protein
MSGGDRVQIVSGRGGMIGMIQKGGLMIDGKGKAPDIICGIERGRLSVIRWDMYMGKDGRLVLDSQENFTECV